MGNDHVHPIMRCTINSIFQRNKLYNVPIGVGIFRLTVNDIPADSPAHAKRRAVEIVTQYFSDERRFQYGTIEEVQDE